VRNAYILVRKPKGKGPLRRPMQRWEEGWKGRDYWEDIGIGGRITLSWT